MKYGFKKVIPLMLFGYSLFGMYSALLHYKAMDDISLPYTNEIPYIDKILTQKENEKELTNQEREILFLKRESYNYHLMLISKEKYLSYIFGISSIICLFLSVYLFNVMELKDNGNVSKYHLKEK